MKIIKNGAPIANSARRHAVAVHRAAIEALEGRTLLTSVVVNSISDTATGTGVVTLRDAINIADASKTATAITFDPTVFANAQTITLNGTDLELSNTAESTTVTGPAAGVTVSGNGKSAVFQVDAKVPATITGITITKGSSTGVTNSGKLTLNNATITANASTSSSNVDAAGGIYNLPGATLSLSNDTVSNNKGTDNGMPSVAGGGIINEGTASLSNVTLSGNAGSNKGGYAGGGMYNIGTATLSDVTITANSDTGKSTVGGFYNTGTATLANVAIFANKSTGLGPDASGGGIVNSGMLTLTDITVSGNADSGNNATSAGAVNNTAKGAVTLTNVTLTGNTLTSGGYQSGGAIHNTGTMTFANVTITNNTSNGGLQYTAGGIASAGGAMMMANTIIAGNHVSGAGSNSGTDVTGAFNSMGYNLIGAADTSTGWVAHDLTGTVAKPLNPDLGPLANNGGFAQTLLPLTGSPVIGAGSVALIPKGITTDQRGLPRIYNGKVDIGAVELQPTILITAPANQAATQGKSVNVALGSFAETLGTSPYKVTINWGDGSANTILTLSAAGTIPATAHTFAKAGTLSVSETITDAKGVKSNVATFTDVVAPGTALPASISGAVFNDGNGDGKLDDGEFGVGLWTVDLSTGGKVVATATTNISGDFSFTGLTAGTYVVKVVQVSGTQPTKPTGGTMTLTLTAGEASTGNLFGEEAVA